MIEIITGMPDNVLAAAAHGKITGEDYENVLIPALEEKFKIHKKLRFFYHLGQDFFGYSLAAIIDDTKVGIKHLTGFEKIAIVTDAHWVREACRFAGVFIPCPVKIFGNGKINEAKTWINE
jgi:hypothetical protein